MKEICVYNEEIVEKAVSKWDKRKADYTKRIYKKLVFWLKLNNVENNNSLYYTTDNVLDNFIDECSNLTYSSMENAKTSLNGLFRELKIEYKFKGRTSKEFRRRTDFYTEEDIKEITNILENDQDKFIICALFEGIKGVKFSDLVSIKASDVDFENHIIHLQNGVDVKMTKELERWTEKAISQSVYCKRGNLSQTSGKYEFNMKNEHVLKPKPTSKNSKGINKFTESGMKVRMSSINRLIEDTPYYPLVAEKVVKSGILLRMKKIEDETGIKWINSNLDEYKKKNHLKFMTFEMLNTYKQIYGK